MYGVTESEKFHILSPIALLHGMVDVQRDEVLREYAKVIVESSICFFFQFPGLSSRIRSRFEIDRDLLAMKLAHANVEGRNFG